MAVLIDREKATQAKALRAQLAALQADMSQDLDSLVSELTEAIDAWDIAEITPRINGVLDPYGWECNYVGLFREEIQQEILRRINTSNRPDKTTELNQEEIDKIADVPDVNCSPVDVRRTIRAMVASGLIATHNPEGKKGRNSTYCLAPVSKPDEKVDPATIRGGQPEKS